jgi:hypothetical protein
MIDFWGTVGRHALRDGAEVAAALNDVAGRLDGMRPLGLTLFAGRLREYLYRLDRKEFAELEVTLANGEVLPQTADSFLYARCACVLAGEVEYRRVVKGEASFDRFTKPYLQAAESLLYLPEQAYEQKTGRRMRVHSEFPIEWMSNRQGWAEA